MISSVEAYLYDESKCEALGYRKMYIFKDTITSYESCAVRIARIGICNV